MNPEWLAPIDRLQTREGDGQEHPEDLGGATHWGITLRTARAWLRRPEMTSGELRAYERSECAELYWRHIIVPQQLHIMLPIQIAEMVFDGCVLFGERMAIRWLQESLNEHGASLVVDGRNGPKTLHATTMANADAVAFAMTKRRVDKHCRVVTALPAQAVFLRGWCKRAFAVARGGYRDGGWW